jgi:hypothetical protein
MLLEPAGTVNVPGTVSASLFDFRKTVTSADGAALRVRVHDPPAGWAAAENVHTSDVRVGVVTSDATREREAEAVAVPTVTVRVEACDVVIVLEETINVAEDPTTTRDAGMVRMPDAVLESDTVVIADGAGERVTVQVTEEFEVRLEALHCSEGVIPGAVATSERVMPALEPLREAVRVAV